MQPTYLPWMGYFALIDFVDVFVFLDDVQFERRSWQQRNRIKGPNGEVLLTVPVRKAAQDTSLGLIGINYEQSFPRGHIANIEHNYVGTHYLSNFWGPIRSVLESRVDELADLNIGLIQTLSKQLGISTAFVRSSELFAAGKKDQYLSKICVELAATAYIAPAGSRSYLEGSEYFDACGVPVQYFDFEHPAYVQQFGAFSSHLSVIDLLFNVGPDATEVMRSGY